MLQNAPREHSAILLTFIKLPFVFKTFVLSTLSGRLRQVLLYQCQHDHGHLYDIMCPLRLIDKFYHKLTHRLSAHGRCSQVPGPYMGLVFVKNAWEKRANGLQKESLKGMWTKLLPISLHRIVQADQQLCCLTTLQL